MQLSSDTIVANATASGRAGVAIIRVSGSATQKIAQNILKKIPQPRIAEFLPFYDFDQQILDQGIAIFFPKPHSLTGEDVLELHCHGNAILVDILLNSICKLGARPSAPGEFLQRAFLNNKIDLAEAEAIADMIDAQSEQALRSASRSMQGIFSEKIQIILRQLIELRKLIEAYIDFSDEEIEFLSQNEIKMQLEKILELIIFVENSATQGALLQSGMRITIIGEPNAGKSELINRLTGQATAIVTPIAGTTRDVIREKIQIDGLPVHLSDTAGIRETEDLVEQLGIERALQEIEMADAILLVHDGTKNFVESNLLEKVAHKKLIIIFNKIDLTKQQPKIEIDSFGNSRIYLSAKTGEGIGLLKQCLKNLVGYQAQSENVFSARRRHLVALDQAKKNIEAAINLQQSNYLPELLAEELRLAQVALDAITGRFSSDDLLGEIFSSFCIGK